ncbi:MAG: hypothetical protein ACOX3K_01370 [Bacilli bacterium]|jgi:hypothetical protein
MKIKTTVVQNLTFMALMSAINVIASVLALFEPFLGVAWMLVLPLVSVLVVIYCQNRYLPIYLIASIAIVTIASLSDLGNVFFYIIPAILTGTIFGFLIKSKSSLSLAILFGAFAQVLLTYIGLLVAEIILNQDFIFFILKLFGLHVRPDIYLIVPCGIFLLSLIQTVLSLFVVIEQLPKLRIEINDTLPEVYAYMAGFLFVLSWVLPLFLPDLVYFVFAVAVFLSVSLLIPKIIKRQMNLLIAGIISVFLTLILIGILNPHLPQKYIPLLTGTPFLILDIFILFDYHLRGRGQSSKISSRKDNKK